MNRKQKKELRQRQSTRQLMGIVRVTPHGIVTDSGERVFFLIQPDNLSVLFSSASSRKFVLVLPLDEKSGADESALRQLEKAICDHGLRVRLAEEQDVKRLLAIYYRQDLTTEVFRDFDGEEYVHG